MKHRKKRAVLTKRIEGTIHVVYTANNDDARANKVHVKYEGWAERMLGSVSQEKDGACKPRPTALPPRCHV